MTTLLITPTPAVDCKLATLVGCVSVREKVAVTMAGLGSRVGDGLILRVMQGSVCMAYCEQWTAAGVGDVDATGTMDLNQRLLIAAMARVREHKHMTFALGLWSIVDQEYIIDVPIEILQCKLDPSESAPMPLAPWGTDLTDIESDIADLQAAVLAHAHAGVDSALIAHGSLTGIGVMTHAAVEAALANLQVSINAHADRLAALEAWRTSATALISSAGDAIAVIEQWKASAIPDLAGVQTAVGGLQAQLAALTSLAPANLGWDVGVGTDVRSISETPTYGTLIKVVRTLVADLKGRGVI